MASKTIYPYGVGGQTPSGIDIVNDLTTGGADKALSAEMGKELKDLVDLLEATRKQREHQHGNKQRQHINPPR